MSPRERREAERRQKRRRILDAARELFVEQGYDAVSMRDVAKRISHSTTAIYSHFPSKQELFSELCAQDYLGLREAFGRISGIEDPLERVIRLGRAYLEHAIANPYQYKLMFMTAKVAEIEHGHPMLERNDPDQDAYAFLVATITHAIDAGEFDLAPRDPHLVAQVFWAGLHGIISLHLTHACDPAIEWRPIPETAEFMIGALIRGLSTRTRDPSGEMRRGRPRLEDPAP
ncbi:MAG: TetR/AcrR family transcriptional regulator [Isosphaeraceae bacterium]|nr:TetR/AcrR family transcriptional regulator [Isosphaeraceae bacterium]